MLSCKEVARMVSESLDEGMPFHRRILMWGHYLLCKPCLRYEKQILFLKKLTKSYIEKFETAGFGPHKTLATDARERIKTALRENNKSS